MDEVIMSPWNTQIQKFINKNFLRCKASALINCDKKNTKT